MTSFSYIRHCTYCRVQTAWLAQLRPYSTFLDIKCGCTNCGHVAAAIIPVRHVD